MNVRGDSFLRSAPRCLLVRVGPLAGAAPLRLLPRSDYYVVGAATKVRPLGNPISGIVPNGTITVGALLGVEAVAAGPWTPAHSR